MKVEKFKVLLYLKKSGLDKSGKAPIMGRITVNRTMAQFSCKLSCTPGLWNPRESRLNGKSREAVETNAKIDKLLLDINAAFDSLLERKGEFDAASVKDAFQGSMKTQMTLMKMLDALRDEVKSRIGIDRAKGTYPAYDLPAVPCASSLKPNSRRKTWPSGSLRNSSSTTMRISSLTRKGTPWTPYGITWQFSRKRAKGLSGRTLRAVHVPALRPPETDRQDSQGTVP